jgi:hypothetical protein
MSLMMIYVSLCCWLQLDISFAINMCFEMNLHASFCGVRNWYVKAYECKCGCRRWSTQGGIDPGQPKFTLWSSYPCSKFHCAGMPHKGSQLMFVMLSWNLSNGTFYTKCRCSSPSTDAPDIPHTGAFFKTREAWFCVCKWPNARVFHLHYRYNMNKVSRMKEAGSWLVLFFATLDLHHAGQ